jgi:hypothetical protein
MNMNSPLIILSLRVKLNMKLIVRAVTQWKLRIWIAMEAFKRLIKNGKNILELNKSLPTSTEFTDLLK